MRNRKSRSASPERAKTDKSLREERENTDRAIRGDRKASERDAEGVIEEARATADAAVSAERKKTDKEALLPPRPVKKGAVKGQRVTADRLVRGQRATADHALRADLKGRADALDALLVHERAATDAYLLTERVRSDTEVSNRDDFLGMVAHDVRNLLNLVVLSVQLLRPSDEEPPPHITAAAARITRYVARMNRLIGDLVDVTSIDAGKLAMASLPGDAAELVEEAAEAFLPAAREKGVSLSVGSLPRGLPAMFDHERMLQVFANLLSNAIKFTPRGGDVTVSAMETDGSLRFCVEDTGVGIPPPMLESIFERFWQVGENDSRGLGLGLYISKCIVLAHGGRIWAESEPGKGSQLFFTLPASEATADRPDAKRA